MKRIIFLLSIAITFLLSCKNEKLVDIKDSAEDSWYTEENLKLEGIHKEMLEPIKDLKSSDPKIYWFIVSWLNTNYKKPVWKGYGTEGWKEKTKNRGIDCSGFSRVMQAEMFNKKIRGSSQGILTKYCQRKNVNELKLGDLLFFKAPYSNKKRIVHMGVYLNEGYFVHVTSPKSAAMGLGLSINTLAEKIWSENLVAAGEVK